MRTCKGCGETKPPSEYRRCRNRKDGLEAKCKTCRAARERERRKRDPTYVERERQRVRKRKDRMYAAAKTVEERDRIRYGRAEADRRARRRASRERRRRFREHLRRAGEALRPAQETPVPEYTCRYCRRALEPNSFYACNRRACKQCRREHYRARYQANRDQERERTRAYKHANPEIVARQHDRRWRRAAEQATGTVTRRRIKELLAKGRRCYWCGKRFRSASAKTVDHVVPLSKGGKHCMSNICVACRWCNTSKRDRGPDAWTPDEQLSIAI